MAAILFVRVKSQLEAEELERRLSERRPRFLEVPGLVQKIYGRDETSGATAGFISSRAGQRWLHFVRLN